MRRMHSCFSYAAGLSLPERCHSGCRSGSFVGFFGGPDPLVTGPAQSAFRPVQSLWTCLSGTLPLLLKLPVCVLVTILLLIVTWIIRPFDRWGAWLRSFTVFWAKTMLWICRVRVKTVGLAILDPSEQYVFVSNHASWIDIPILLACLPPHVTFVAKRELFRNAAGGRLLAP